MIKTWLQLSVILTAIPLQAQLHSDWENPGVYERGQVAPHATLMPFDTEDAALEGRRKNSPNHMSLNGTWQFNWSANPDEAPVDFYKPSYDRLNWNEISVPSNWQMQGFGYPLFRNIGLPHPHDPPLVPKDFNPVASYFRSFKLPEEWKNKQVFLHFEGVHSASYVWINGKEVGYNQGGMEPAEYDITTFLKKGENCVAVKVLRYSDGSYLEDQDTWRLSGIYRDVYLMATPKQHIRDFYVRTDLDEDYRDAILKVEAEVSNYQKKPAEHLFLHTSLFDDRGRKVHSGSSRVPVGKVAGGQCMKVSENLEIPAPALWSAEYPNLYTLVLSLGDASGRILEYIGTRVGFREVEVKDKAILVNGVAVKFNGVNSHMMHPETGHAMDVATMRKDLELMKRFNINCVRTSHYPPNVAYLDLANELGIYVVDETGDEAHAYIYLSSDTTWKEQYLDRMRKMVYRDRNQPSVVIWSAGNESGPGDNICALMEEGKRIDPSRPAWMYGGNRDEDPATNPIRCEDIVGPRYLKPFMLEQRFAKADDPRPSFMDEYIAATGNSLGGLDEYWELIFKYPRLTGGAIWDWISPGITMPVILTKDDSPGNIQCALINRAHLVEAEQGKGLYLSGHDDWLVTYRDPSLDISGEALSLSFHVKPEAFNGNGDFLTKGDYQFGIVQRDPDYLSFYLNTGEKCTLNGRLPDDWEGNWHHVAGIYDGYKMELYVDGKIIGTRACRGAIRNSPYWVVLGKSAELRDDHRGYMCHATLDRVRIFDRVLDIDELMADDRSALLQHAKLWLDFETAIENGQYWSTGIPGRTYGLVWPDRSVQPELWQLKKSPQPVKVEFCSKDGRALRITNRHHFRDLAELACTWTLSEDGSPVQDGMLDLALPAGKSTHVELPYSQPELKPGSVYYLELSFRTKVAHSWAAAGHEVAWEQIELPFYMEASSPQAMGFPLSCLEENGKLHIKGRSFSYVFSRESGELESMKVEGKELVRRGLHLNVWRAPLANDLDSWSAWHTEMGYTLDWMGKETANGWRSLGLQSLEHALDQFSWSAEGEEVIVRVETSAHSNNVQTGYKVNYEYSINREGEISLTSHVSPQGFQPRWLPKVGLQMELSPDFSRIEWLGRGPYETYPDRKTGAKIGRYTSTVQAEYVPYIIPQDYGNKTDVHWLKLTDPDGCGLLVRGEEKFSTSVQGFSTDHLDRCHYPFQLKVEDQVTLNLDHRVSGVGGTAISVLNHYRVSPREYTFTFHIKALQGEN